MMWFRRRKPKRIWAIPPSEPDAVAEDDDVALPPSVHGPTRYWVGGDDGEWDKKRDWSATPGGPGGAAIPAAEDTPTCPHGETSSHGERADGAEMGDWCAGPLSTYIEPWRAQMEWQMNQPLRPGVAVVPARDDAVPQAYADVLRVTREAVGLPPLEKTSGEYIEEYVAPMRDAVAARAEQIRPAWEETLTKVSLYTSSTEPGVEARVVERDGLVYILGHSAAEVIVFRLADAMYGSALLYGNVPDDVHQAMLGLFKRRAEKAAETARAAADHPPPVSGDGGTGKSADTTPNLDKQG